MLSTVTPLFRVTVIGTCAVPPGSAPTKPANTPPAGFSCGRIVKFSAFIMACRKAGWDTLKGKGYRVAEKEQYDDFSHLRKAKAAELIRQGRTPVLRRKILAYWGEVKELKAEGMGFRPIADYLARTRKVKTSASYLAKLWKEVESGD